MWEVEMEGQDRARQQSALDIDFTVDGADMDTMRKKVLESIGFTMVQNDGDESMGLPRFRRLTSRDIQTIHDSTHYAAVQSQSIASRSVEPALGAKHRISTFSHIPSSLSRQGQAYSYDQPSVAFDEEDSTPAEIAAQGRDGLLDSNIAAQGQATQSSFQADTELMQQSHRPLPTSPYHVLSVEHHRDAGIQRPASPRRRPLLDRLDDLRVPVDAVLDCALPVSQPFSQSTRSACRSERSIMNTYNSPVRSMGPGIPTMASLNLSIPLYLRPRKGGNRDLRNLSFLPSPLRNEINFSTSDRDLPSSSSEEITSVALAHASETAIPSHGPEQTTTLHESEKTIGEEPPRQLEEAISSPQAEQAASSHELEHTSLAHEPNSVHTTPSHELQQPTCSDQSEDASSSQQSEHNTPSHPPSLERIVPCPSSPRFRFSSQRSYTSSLYR
ncbi:hypothetical protein D6D00_10379 [Aureobasidium pullulans]|nr:hypothetical protein D6D00_10379 [Aureobasidium pullulans]